MMSMESEMENVDKDVPEAAKLNTDDNTVTNDSLESPQLQSADMVVEKSVVVPLTVQEIIPQKDNNEAAVAYSSGNTSVISHNCEKCSYKASDQVLFDLHVCKVKSGKETSPQKEIKITVEGDMFLCGECGFSSQGHGFEEHLMCHLLLRPYQCIYCQESFINRKEIGKHVSVAHKGKKMNCALKAMKKAKSFMAETRKNGSYTFFARVSGRVPLGINKSVDQSKSQGLNPAEKKVNSDCLLNSKGTTQTSSELLEDTVSGAENTNEKVRELAEETVSKCVDNRCGIEISNKSSSELPEKNNESKTSIEHETEAALDKSNSSLTPDVETLNAENNDVPDITPSPPVTNTTEKSGEKQTVSNESISCYMTCSSNTVSVNSQPAMVKENSKNVMDTTEPDSTNQNASVANKVETEHQKDADINWNETASSANCAEPSPERDAEPEFQSSDTLCVPLNSVQTMVEENSEETVDATVPDSTNQIESAENNDEPEHQKEINTADYTSSYENTVEPVNAGKSGSEFQSSDTMAIKIVAAFSLTNICPKSNTCLIPNPSACSPETEIDVVGMDTDAPPSEPEQNKETLIQLTAQEVLAAVIKQQRSPNFYACGFQCDFSCLNSMDFREHLQKEHYGSTTYPCSHCGWTTHNEDGLLKHVTGHAHAYNKTAPLYFCGVSRCRFGTNLLPEFINHMNILHPGLKQHSCKECNAVFIGVTKLLQHFEDNYLHVVNCPHCSCKGQNRQVILKHISEAHPGKPKMLSVGKQIICKDRKINSFHQLRGLISNIRRSRTSVNNLEHILNLELPQLFPNSRHEGNVNNNSSNQAAVVTEEEPHQQQVSECDNQEESELNEDDDAVIKSENYDDLPSPASSADAPVNSKHIDQTKCKFCTFVARDAVRLNGHQTCHIFGGDGRHIAKKQRFKCPYCPQCFENLTKFTSHVSCHPGLNKYILLTCTHCEFNSNQKHNILKHIETRCGRNYRGVADDLYFEEEKRVDSRVLECENCNYQTRHKIHLKVHYEGEHQTAHEEMYGKQSKVNSTSETTLMLNTEDASVLRSPPSSSSRENISKKFMCPVCFYLLPKGADLKKHIRKHPELGKVSLVLFRCRYCSCASTAKHVIAGHIKDKHPGREIALVKKIISVDTRDSDNSFSETQVSETPVCIPDSEVAMMLSDGTNQQISVSKIIEEAVESSETFHHVFIVPDYNQGKFSSAVKCPCCEFISNASPPLIEHLKSEHPKICVVGKESKPIPKYYKLGSSVPFGLLTLLHSAVNLKQEAIVLAPKDVFAVSAQCPKCAFSTYFKQNLALHIRDHHREFSILEAQKQDFKFVEKKASTEPQTKAEATLAKLQQLRKQDPIIVGSGILDDKLKGLYENLGFVSRCAICGTERPKRYHMHVHVLRHLNVSLWKCQYCEYKGLERYKMCKHIKDQHPQKKMAIKYLPVDIEDKITEYLAERSLAASQGTEVFAAKVSPGAKYSMDAAFSPLGNDDIDEHLKEMYREDGEIFYCILCSFTVRRKFAVHRHLVSSHLAIALVGCGYCGFRGIDRKSIIDHSHEEHAQSTLNVILLPNDLKKIVSDLLSSSGLKEEEPATMPIAELTVQFQEEPLKPKKQKARKSFQSPKPATIECPQDIIPSEATEPIPKSENMKKYVMGTELLDSKLRILFSVNFGKFQCNVCESEFPRKYAIHRHLLMSHLKVGLMQCPLCSYTGVERYIVVNHLKEHHKVENQIPYPCTIDMEAKISEFLSQELGNRSHDTNRRRSRETDRSVSDRSTGSGSEVALSESRPMVVALFNKRKALASVQNEKQENEHSSKKIKKEIMEDDDNTLGNKDDSAQPEEIQQHTEDTGDKPNEDEFKPELNWETDSGNNNFKPRSMFDVGTKINILNLSNGYIKRFGCERCSFTSAHRSNVQRHVFRVHEKYRYKICKVCGYRTLSNILIRQHVQEKHGDATDDGIIYEKSDRSFPESAPHKPVEPTTVQQGLYACAYCDFETNTSDAIVQHMESKHPKTSEAGETNKAGSGTKSKKSSSSTSGNSPVLKIPSFQAKQLENVKKKNLSCDYCDFQCSIYRLLKSHVALVHKDQPKAEENLIPKPSWKYACVECHLKMDASTKMKCHIGRHFNYKPYVCETCSADFASPDEMRKHIRRYLHSEKINYVKQDDKEGQIEALLMQSKQYASDILEGKVPNISPHRVGQRIVRKKPEFVPPSDIELPPSKKSKIDRDKDPSKQIRATGGFGCSLCTFTSQSINDVSTHHMRAHRNKTFFWKDLVMGYICDVNGRVVESETELPKKKPATFKTSHNSKTPWHTCLKCGFNTPALQGMMGHVKAHGTRDYLCAYCANRYFKRAMLNRHQRSIHKSKRLWIIHQLTDDVETTTVDDNETEPLSENLLATTNLNYCCHLCNFVADSLYQYRLHLPSHGQCDHLVPDIAAESPLKCGYCAYVAPDQKDFSVHINAHLNDRTFKCSFCQYSAYNRKDVASHLNYTHPNEDLSDENKCIISSKDATKLSFFDISKCSLPMLANLDPRVMLQQLSMKGTKINLASSSMLVVSGAFDLLESEIGAVTDGDQTDDQLLEQTAEEAEMEGSDVDEQSLVLDEDQIESSSEVNQQNLCLDSNNSISTNVNKCSQANPDTIKISSIHSILDNVLELNGIKADDGPLDDSANTPKIDPLSDFEVFDSIDKAIEQLSRHNESDSSKVERSAKEVKNSKNIFDSLQSCTK